MATIDDFGGSGQPLDDPPLGGPDGWAAAVRDALEAIGADNWVTAARIAAGAVGSSELQDSAVTSAKIANDTITSAKIATNAVGSDELADNAVDTAAIANGAVTAAKIGALTTKGDLLARDGSGAVRLPVGTDGQVLVADAAASAGVKWGAEPAVKATVGNLLTDNQASGTDTLGTTEGFSDAGVFTLTSSTDWSAIGSRSLKAVISSATYPVLGVSGAVRTQAISAGDTYTILAKYNTGTLSGGTLSGFRMLVNFYDASETVVGGTIAVAGVGGAFEYTYVAPAGAAYVLIRFGINGPGANVGEHFYLDALSLHKGAGGKWAMPGYPIVHTGIRPNPADTSQVQIWNDATATWITV